MSGDWYYIESGVVEDKQVGPLSNKEVLELLAAGTLKPKTKLVHPEHTAGEWLPLSEISVLKVQLDKINAAKAEQKQKDQRQREEMKQKASEQKERQRQTRPQPPLPTPAPSEVKVVRTGFQVFIAFVLIGGWAFTALILLFLCAGYSDLGAEQETVFQQIAIHSEFTANAVALFVTAYCADRCLTYISR